jgi:DNA polymerase elongation subunit (family B)
MKKEPRLFFYDFEVFSKSRDPITGRSFWLVVFAEYGTKKGKVIVNNVEELNEFYESYKDDIFVGFNCRNYDQFILKGLLLGMDAGYINDKLILEDKKGFEVVRQGYKLPFNNFDIMPNPPVGLKTLEAFMGSRIKESSVPFDLDRPLTEEEIKETIQYCVNDVRETIKVFDAKREEFDSQLQLIEAFDLDMTQFSRTKAQLSAHILEATKHENRGDEFDFIFPDTLVLNKYRHVKEWYENPENKNYTIEPAKKGGKKKKRQLEVDIAGVPHVLGYGGIHGSRDRYSAEGIILCCDISSMYPALIIEYNLMSRNVLSVEKYKQIRDERLRLKAVKNPKQQPLKIVLNATFGTFKDQFNALFDPLMSNSICISGQLLLIDLIEKIEPYCELIQSNTDGIFMKVDNYEMVDKVKEIAAEWEKRTRLDLEWDEFKKIYQKDVNNYILIPEKLYDDKGKPRWKSKGAWVKELNDLDYDLPIINKSLVNYFVHGISFEETINNCNELREFQKVVKVSSKYLFGIHGEERLSDRVLRTFADNREGAKGVFKMKLKLNKEGIMQEVAEKIGGTPEKCFINNEDIKGLLIPEYLDKEWYIKEAYTRLKGFTTPKKTKKKKGEEVEQTEMSLT